MKTVKKLCFIALCILGTYYLMGCSNNKASKTETVANGVQLDFEQSETQSSTDLSNVNLDEFVVEEPSDTSTSNTISSSYAIEEDFSDYDFYYTEGIFTITSVKTTTKTTQGVIIVNSTATGFISGLPGTYVIDLPYSQNWEKNDKAYVSYNKAYNEDTEEIIICDLLFLEKTDIKVKTRRERLEEEREKQELIDESIKESESIAKAEQEKAEIAAAEEQAKKESQAAVRAERQKKEEAQKTQIDQAQKAAAIQARINQLIGE